MSGVPLASACTTCGEHTHCSRKCPELWSDTNEGFYTGGGSNRDYGEEDDSLSKHDSYILLVDGLDIH